MALDGRMTIRTHPQAMAVANWYSLATLTASAYVQLVPAEAERSEGVWVYNNNTVSATSNAYLYKNAAPTIDGIDGILIVSQASTLANGRSVVFIPGTGAVFAKSTAAGIMSSLTAVSQ